MNYAKLIDHAVLHPTATADDVRRGCEIADRYRVASICVKPCHVPMAARLLSASEVAVSTVIGFPSGGQSVAVKQYEAERALGDGAVELDMVVNLAAVLEEDWTSAGTDIAQVLQAAHAQGAILKVIFETDYLPLDKHKIELCRICSEMGVDFVKTSTGFGYHKDPSGHYFYHGATEHDVALMRKHCLPTTGIKASGGIRDLARVQLLHRLGATRIGTSSTAAILEQAGN